MPKNVRIRLNNGGVALATIPDDVVLQDHLDRWSQSARAEWLPATIEEFSGVRPADRTFRGAWSASGQDVEVDMAKARDIHMDRIRVIRNEILAETDVEFTRALEESDTAKQATLRAKRQLLRDLPQTYNLARHQTPEDLDADWPPDLDGRRVPKADKGGG